MQTHFLNYIVLGVSVISVIFFVFVTISRRKVVREKAKNFGMKKKVTDPILYWVSYISAFVILAMKSVMFFLIFSSGEIATKTILLGDILPSILLIIFTRTIGRSMILKSERKLYMNKLVTEIESGSSFVKQDNKWQLQTKTGVYRVDLTNTSIFEVANMTDAKIEDKEFNANKKD